MLELKEGFSLQFEDPDFGNALCNFHDINELSVEKAALKVLYEEITLEICHPPDPSDASSASSLDTASVSSMSSLTSYRNLYSATDWPSPFVIPKKFPLMLNFVSRDKWEMVDKLA